MHKTFKYRLFTNANQERELSITLETHRRLYNQALDGKQLCWETAGVDWNYFEQSKWFKVQRSTNPYFANLNFASAQKTLKGLDKAYKSFFDRVKRGAKPGVPRFKSKDRFNSFQFDMSGNGGGCKILPCGKVRLQNIGTIRVRWHRQLPEGKIKTATVVRENGKWFICFCVEVQPVRVEGATGAVGIDVGLKSFVMTSDGEELGDSRRLESNLAELRRRQRALSRCRRGSATRKKVKQRVTTLHAKIANSRRDSHHKVARTLVNRYAAIAAESLNIQGMLKNRRLARRISDAGWGSFVGILQFKAEEAGTQMILVDPKNTSQECSGCGNVVRKSLDVRIHRCDCGLVLDRDVNAAKNILARAEPRIAKPRVTLV